MPATPLIGLGAICAVGADVNSIYGALSTGVDGLRPLVALETGLKQIPVCAQVNVPLDESAPNRTTALALHAAQQALAVLPPKSGLRIGLVLATTIAGITRSEIFLRDMLSGAGNASNAGRELAFHEPSACAGWLCRTLSLHGFHTMSTACSTGLHAIGMAERLVRAGYYDACLAVGADALSILTIRGFASLLLIDPSGCRPFDKRRAGISLGEGAAALLVASTDATARLGAKVQARMAGWGASADGFHMTAPHPEGRGAAAAVTAALADAGVLPRDVGLLAAHGTATPDNDAAEIKALRGVFGALPPFCSMKRTLGHTLAASGTLEAVMAIRCMQEGLVPPTVGFEQIDDAIGASPSPAISADIRHVVKNSFGFGGNNASLVLSREDA